MILTINIAVFIASILIIIYSAEKLVKSIASLSINFGVSTFLISLIFIGFDPENLAVTITGSAKHAYGIAMGSVLGSLMVAISLAFGIKIILSNVKFKTVSKTVLAIPVISLALLYVLSIDKVISRIDGFLLLATFMIAITYLFKLSKKGVDIKPEHEIEELFENSKLRVGKTRSVIVFIASLAGIVIGSELLINTAKPIIRFLGVSDTVFGMTILAFLISIEELARELPAALKGMPDVSFGNVAGSVMHFCLLNTGIAAIASPIMLNNLIVSFYMPLTLITTLFIMLVMLKKQLPKWSGFVLIALYALFVVRGFY